MATKKFSQMTTKKLNALLATASDEDKKSIEAVLAAREQASVETASPKASQENPVEFQDENPLTAEEEAALEAAEKNDGVNPLYKGKKAASKMTDDERHALAEKLKDSVIYHRCEVVPFNTAEWIKGYIAGVIEEKRSNKVLLAIKTDDGRRIVKVHDSNLLRILDETVEPEKKTRARKVKDPSARIEWTPEEIIEEVNKVIGNVGKTVTFEKYRMTDENGQEHVEMVTGRIVAIVPDKRTQHLLYRISVPAPIEGNPLAVKVMHKTVGAENLAIAEEFDEEGAQLNAKYKERREAAAVRTPITPQDRVVRFEEIVKKAEEKLKKAQEELEAKKKQLENARQELNDYLDSQTNTASSSSEEPLA